MKLNFLKAALSRYKAASDNLQGILSLAEQRACVSVRSDMNGISTFVVCGTTSGEVSKRNVDFAGSVVDEDKDSVAEEMMMVK